MENGEDPEWLKAQKIVISTDLITKTKKHLKFLEAVNENGKLYTGPILERAISRYKYCWLPLLAKFCMSKVIEWQLVVPLDCEWIWHCHRLNPVRYAADCKELFGIILDPCGVVISSIEGTCKKETEKLWNNIYPEEPYELNLDYGFNNDIDKKLMASPSTKYDLVSAVSVRRQSSFYYQVARTFMKDDIFLEGAVERYKGFLHMIKRNKETKSKNFCVPIYDIDLMWHTHQLHPLSYCNDMMRLLGNVLDHDDTDSDRSKGKKLDVAFSRTTKQWNEIFSSRYWRAGAMYRDLSNDEGPKRSKILSQSSDIMFIELMMEVIEVKQTSNKYNENHFLYISKKQNDMLFKGKSHLSFCTKTEEIQAVILQCEPKGELLFELFDGSSSKSLGTCSITISELDPKLSTPKWLEFQSDTPLEISDMCMPITLGVVISITPPSPIMQHMIVGYGEQDENGNCDTTGGACSGSGGCGAGCGGGGGGGCRASCGGCRSSCGGGGGCRGGGGCGSK